jgi:hypothetical protein
VTTRNLILILIVLIGGAIGAGYLWKSQGEAGAKEAVPKPPSVGTWMVLQGMPPKQFGKLTLGEDRGQWQPVSGVPIPFLLVRQNIDEGFSWETKKSLPGLGSFFEIVIKDRSWIMRAKGQAYYLEPLDSP